MPDVSDVNYDENKSIITWKYDGHNQSLELKSVDQYELDQSNGFILVLTGTDSVPDSLYIIDAKDGSYRSLRPPSGFDFYYLTNHPQLGASVVCVSENPVEGWRDWHFSVEPGTNNLSRAIPAY